MNLYTIDSSSPYMIKLTMIANIEDAGDDFVTEEELCEMLGEEYNENKQYYRYNTIVRNQAIIEAVGALKAEANRIAKKTLVVKDNDLVEVLQRGPVSDYVKGVRRVGNRLFFHEVKGPKVERFHASSIAGHAERIINKGGLDITFKNVPHHVKGTLTIIQKLVKWEDFDWSAYDAQYVAFCKEVWDNPSMFEKVPKEPEVAEPA